MIKQKQLIWFLLLGATFIVAYPMSSILSSVIYVKVNIGSIALATQYGAIFLAFGKGCLDIIQEFWGKKTRRTVALTGMLARVMVFVVILIGLGIGTYDHAKSQILLDSLRIMFIGEFTTWLMEYWLDSEFYQWMLKKFNKRVPVVRSLLSNISSQIVNAPILAYLGFWGVMPNNVVHAMAWTKPYFQIPLYLLVALFTGGVIKLLRKRIEDDSNERDNSTK